MLNVFVCLRNIRLVVVLAMVLGFVACTTKHANYCDDERPCEDPAKPFCDAVGQYPASNGINNVCIAYPFDSADGGTDGQVVAALGVAPATAEFAVNMATEETDVMVFSVTNNNIAPTGEISISLVGPDSFELSENTCTKKLAAGLMCSFVVTFTPTSAGQSEGTITISANPGGETTLPLVGNGVGATAALTSLRVFAAQELPLQPTFASDTETYEVRASVIAQQVVIEPTATDPNATITVDGVSVANGQQSGSIAVSAEPKTVNVIVNATSGDRRTYTVSISAVDGLAPRAYVKASNTGAGDEFGHSLAMDGDVMVVGAIREDSIEGQPSENNAMDSGAVYVFRQINGRWQQEQILKPTTVHAGDWFGYAVAVRGDLLAVGAPYNNSNADQSDSEGAYRSGAVYIFRRVDGQWTEEQILKASNAGIGDMLGYSVAIGDDIVVVGAKYEDSPDANGPGQDTVENAGAAYIFRCTNGKWDEEQMLKASNAGNNDEFGMSVAVSGDVVVVGAQYEDSATKDDPQSDTVENTGAAYVYRLNGESWQQEAFLKASSPAAHDWFGSSVAVENDVIAVSAHGKTMDASSSGAVYVFRRVSGQWGEEAILKASNPLTDDYWGWPVALSGNVIVAGTTYKNEGAGAACLFRYDGESWSEKQLFGAPNRDTGDAFGFAVALSGATVAVGAYHEDSAAIGIDSNGQLDNTAADSGAVYIFR